MTKTKQFEPSKEGEPAPRGEVDGLIGDQVFGILGKPDGLLKLQVRHLWEDHYRVNVLVGPDAASARVANSFFLVANREGKILTSTPLITKQY